MAQAFENEVALEEIEALRAIFMEDFSEEVVPTKSAWKVAPQKQFVIQLTPLGDELKDFVRVALVVRFTRRYPSEPPQLFIRKDKGLSDAQVEELGRLVVQQANRLKGQEMIYEIANYIQEHLCQHNSVIRGVKNVSFFEQMEDRREQAKKEEQERTNREVAELRQREEEARNEEDLALASQIQTEIERKQAKIKEERERRRKSFIPTPIPAEEKAFPTASAPPDHREVTLDVVVKGPRIAHGLLSSIHMVQPVDEQPKLVIKEISITNPFYFAEQGKKKLNDIFAELSTISRIRHASTVTVFDFKLRKTDGRWFIEILIEDCGGGTLDMLIRRCGGVKFSVARMYMKELLKALAYLHSQNIIHKDIQSRNILFAGGNGEAEDVKFSNIGYSRRLLDLHQLHKLDPSLAELPQPFADGWISPELTERPGIYGRKNDIWSLGRTFAEMVFGLTIYQYPSTEAYLQNAPDIPHIFSSLLSKMLAKDASHRPNAIELLNEPFFGDVVNVDVPIALEIMNTGSVAPSPAAAGGRDTVPRVTATTPQKPMFPQNKSPEPNIFDGQMLSRYKIDFEEIEFLGKGGFGEVVKARNRIDGRFYAIKKIKLDPKDKSNSNKILREVQTLSRLHHQFVVRYYQAWFEDATGLPWDDESDSEEFSGSDEDEEDEDEDASLDASDWLASKENSRSLASISISFGLASGSKGMRDSLTESTTENEASSSESSSDDESGAPSSQTNSYRVLYIQMEYCEKKTLRDVIDDGLDDEEAWRLFRQILEGLAHIHSQGMIHRDLKPSNVFLDGNGNVKIGDFGLALAREDEGTVKAQALEAATFDDVSLTSDVGTPVYVAPEMLTKGGKYSSKVDMYSLGICFFEKSNMSVSDVVSFLNRHAARGDVAGFTDAEYHIPDRYRLEKVRCPSADNPNAAESRSKRASELSGIASIATTPSKTGLYTAVKLDVTTNPLNSILKCFQEEEYISEALRSIVNQNNPLYYSRLVNSLFAQSTDRHKDFTYDYNSNALNLDQMTDLVMTRVHAQVTKVFQKHGAVDIPAPLLIPKSDLYEASSKRPVELLDSAGTLVQLPYDLTVPFARLIARGNYPSLHLPLKRFSIDRVYRCNVAGGQPRSVLECDFDIVTSQLANMCPEAEVIKVVFEILEVLSTKALDPSRHEIRINHCSLLDAVLDTCNVDPLAQRSTYHLLEQLDKPSTWSQIRNHLLHTGFSKDTVDSMERFYNVKGEIDSASRAAERMFAERVRPAAREILSQLRMFTNHLRHLGVKNKVVFVPLLAYNALYHKGGVMFQIAVSGQRKLDVIAAGGRYDHLLMLFRNPFGAARKFHAVGVHFALSKAITAIAVEQAERLRQLVSHKSDEPILSSVRRSDVLVVSFGKGAGVIEERMAIVSELWAAGLAADMSYVEVQSPIDVLQSALAQGYVLCVFIKQKNPDVPSALIKVKNLVTKNEQEVSRSDLVAHVQSEINDYLRPDPSSAHHSKLRRGESGSSGDILGQSHARDVDMSAGDSATGIDAAVHVVPSQWKKGKLKHKDKLVIMERAAHATNNVLNTMRKVPIFAVDLPSSAVKRLTEIDLLQDEESVRKAMEKFPSAQREYVLDANQTATTQMPRG
ncbi:hypothetical protein HK104_010287 [Borealophlyctis nickersoniae]|nr:hypothetical protein HK104_010287 [Borealophlyctis nickersoniae]